MCPYESYAGSSPYGSYGVSSPYGSYVGPYNSYGGNSTSTNDGPAPTPLPVHDNLGPSDNQCKWGKWIRSNWFTLDEYYIGYASNFKDCLRLGAQCKEEYDLVNTRKEGGSCYCQKSNQESVINHVEPYSDWYICKFRGKGETSESESEPYGMIDTYANVTNDSNGSYDSYGPSSSPYDTYDTYSNVTSSSYDSYESAESPYDSFENTT